MTVRTLVSALTCAGLILQAAVPARAEQTLFETVGDWKVVKEPDENGQSRCLLTRVYTEEGEKEVTSVVLAPSSDQVGIALGYAGWDHGKEHKRGIVFLIGDRIVDLHATWSAEGTQLGSAIPNTLLPELLAADILVLRFKDGDATFRIPKLKEAYAAAERCNAPPPIPPQARVNAYMVGLMFQRALAECEVATTARQRSELDRKVAELKPEMAAIESEIRKELASKPQKDTCPAADKIAIFSGKLNQFNALTPEAFSEELERANAEAEAKAAAAKKAAEEQAAADRKADEDRKAAEAQAARQKAADERAAEEKAAADRRAAEAAKAAEAKAAQDKAAAEQRAAEEAKAAEDKAAAEKAATENKRPADETPSAGPSPAAPDAPPAGPSAPRP